MPFSIDKTQLAELETQDSQQRYEYLTEQVLSNQEMWILVGNGGSVLLNSEGTDCVPVWPHQESAEAWIKNEWSDCSVKSISLDTWLERWTPGLTEDKLSIAAFPNQEEESLVISAEEFDDDLRV